MKKRTDEPVIFPQSPQAATFRTELEGWVSRHGIFYGDNEYAARFNGCTHGICACGQLREKNYASCKACRQATEDAKFDKRRNETRRQRRQKQHEHND
jgi:hypothetical protein